MDKNAESMKDKICKYWKYTNKQYKLQKILGAGTFGQVVYAKDR